MKIQVTQKDIDLALQRNPSKCAIAEAIFRISDNNSLNISVFTTALHLNGHSYELPMNATDFIRSFDFDKKLVQPLEIEIPELILV
jgi:hypothetical protein